jgi:hypothetical protein
METTHQFLAGPGNSIIHLEARWKDAFTGWGTVQPIGLPGRKYEPRVTRSWLQLMTSPAAGGGPSSPLELRYTGGSPMKDLPGRILDLAVDGEGQVLVSVDCSSTPLLLPLRAEVGEFTPATFRSELVQVNFLFSDLPLHLPFERFGLSVTPFGTVEASESGEIVRHEWSPDREGCFTRWWQHSRLDRAPFSRYRPPFPFDAIDRRTTIIAQKEELMTLRRWSGHAFLYRNEGKVAGAYWPDLRYRGGANDANPVRFVHTFGRFDEGSGTITELISVDDKGGPWRFGDIGPHFSVKGDVYPMADPIPPSRTPNDWLRHKVFVVDQLLSPGHPPGSRTSGG